MKNMEKFWFGYKKVSPEEKTKNVIDVFDSVADRYNLMNDAMSIGIHRLWKDHFVQYIAPVSKFSGRPANFLDVAGGTGDIAFRIRKKINNKASITLCDLNSKMLETGRNKAIDKGWLNDFNWVTCNAENLPIQNESIDVYTIAFGLRNVTHVDTALKEAHRVLRKGGHFFCMEFSHSHPDFFTKLYDIYSDKIIPYLGEKIANDGESYKYLVESIRQFPDQKQLRLRIKNAGFARAKYHNLSMGIVAIHQGKKL